MSGTIPMHLLEISTGFNGEDLTLSHNGAFISHVCGGGNNDYDIAKYRTSDFAALGSFTTGPYPSAVTYSPDDLVAYASVDTLPGIKVFNANTFLLMGTISGPDVASKLAVDSTGRICLPDTFSILAVSWEYACMIPVA